MCVLGVSTTCTNWDGEGSLDGEPIMSSIVSCKRGGGGGLI